MVLREQFRGNLPSGVSLRAELSIRSLKLASAHGYLHARTDGQVPSVIFGRDEEGRHGNFHPDAYRRILDREAWAKRLDKVHTASKRMRVRSDWQWKELDCSNSSDALLMNIFCYPEVARLRRIRTVLGLEGDVEPEFGFKPRVPLQGGRSDNTEVDMKIGDLLVEAKLTESGFQCASHKLISRYRDFDAVFDPSELSHRNGKQGGYQLIRGALAAYALGSSFCVLCDSRRPDLVEVWYSILRAVRPAELRCRLKLLTWQEIASVLPPELQNFLALKYGILDSGKSGTAPLEG